MARCQWCGAVSREVERMTNGRSELLLCPLCAAQKEVLQKSILRPAELGHPTLWQRIRRILDES